MNGRTKLAALSALVGACAALVPLLAASVFGLLPQRLDGKQVHDYLLDHPEVLVEMEVKLQAKDAEDTAREQRAAMRAIDNKAFFDARIAFVTGPVNAKTSLVEFFDYNCPYCRASLPAVKKFFDAHKRDTRFSFIEFPIKGPDSIVAARASLAARRQPDKFLAFHFALMGEAELVTQDEVFADAAKVGLDVAKLKADMQNPDIDKAIDIARKLALKAKIDGTPAFVINGHLRSGAVGDDDLKDLVKEKPV
jgi:protein-disulfide isomerase